MAWKFFDASGALQIENQGSTASPGGNVPEDVVGIGGSPGSGSATDYSREDHVHRLDATDQYSVDSLTAASALLSEGITSLSGTISATISGNTDNWSPAGINAATAVRANVTSAWNLTGIDLSSGVGGLIILVNVGTGILTLKHDVTSTAANRFFSVGGVDFKLNPQASVVLWYDNTSTRWRVIAELTAATTVVDITDSVTAGGDPGTSSVYAREDHEHAYPPDVHEVRLTKSATQSLNNNTATAITFDGETSDTDAYHDTSSNTSKITIPAGLGGWYLFTGMITFADAGDNTIRQLRFRVDGTTNIPITNVVSTAARNGTAVTIASTLPWTLDAGQYIELIGVQASGGNLNVNATCYFGAVKLSGQGAY